MKTSAVVVLAGLASALAFPHPVPVRRASLGLRQVNESADVSAAVLSPEEAASLEGIVQDDSDDLVDASDILDNLNLDDDDEDSDVNDILDNLNLDGGNLDINDIIDDLNLGDFGGNDDDIEDILDQLSNLDLNDLDEDDLDNLDLLGGIDALINDMGLGDLINVGLFDAFGVNQQLELFLLLQQLQQLVGFGFINQFDVLNLIQQGILLNQFNFGFFKRTVSEWTENHARKERRALREHQLARRQLQACVLPAAGISPVAGVPVAGIPAAAPVDAISPEDLVIPAGEDEDDEERDLSDFTR